MGHLADRLDNLLVKAGTPDGTTFAELRGRSDVTITFAPGYYTYSNESRLADKLQTVARLLWVARTKEYYTALSEAVEDHVTGEHIDTEEQRQFKDARMEIVASGEDDEGTVAVSAAALWNWTVTIAPGTVASVSEPEFCRRAGQAAQRLIADQYRQLRETRMRMAADAEP